MASKFAVPLYLANNPICTNPDADWIKLFVKNLWLAKKESSGTEYDMVLDRPLEDFSKASSATPIVATDTVLEAFGKVQETFESIEIQGAITGTASYVGGKLVIWVPIYTLDMGFRTDYDTDITGVRDGVNRLFTLSEEYNSGTSQVHINGLRMTPGATEDYQEVAPDQINFAFPIYSDDVLTVDYKIIIP